MRVLTAGHCPATLDRLSRGFPDGVKLSDTPPDLRTAQTGHVCQSIESRLCQNLQAPKDHPRRRRKDRARWNAANTPYVI